MALSPLLTAHPGRQEAIIISAWQIGKHGGAPSVWGRIESGLPVDRLPSTHWTQRQPRDQAPSTAIAGGAGMARCSPGVLPETPRDAVPGGAHQGCIKKAVPRGLSSILTRNH